MIFPLPLIPDLRPPSLPQPLPGGGEEKWRGPALIEARRKKRALEDIALDELAGLQHVAMMRLQLKFTADVHAMLAELLEKIRAKLLTYIVDDEGHLNPLAMGPLADVMASAWREMFKQYQGRFEAARRQAALISFAALARYHRYFTGLVAEKTEALAEAGPPGQVGVIPVPFYQPQLQEVLDMAAARVYGDGFKLSQRIWNLDQRGLKGMQQIIMETIANGDSAWNAAQRLESYLGANQECPRWTRTRLRLTKTDIAAGDQSGLVSGSPCESKGVAYSALRLARNEIQIAHAGATDAIFARMPWVEQEQVVLSPSHPPIECVCEEVTAGGENGDGVYPKGTISLPLHVQCLCFKVAVLMKDEDFINGMRGWLNSDAAWPEMDAYATWTKATRQTLAVALDTVLYEQLALPFINWLDGNEAEMDAALGGAP